ncbi:MAG: 3-dehydroquinate synthase [Gemmatimonadetes bacterium]|nr:3-dehydroquinate synthase [Gemmatimonadota bacterium]
MIGDGVLAELPELLRQHCPSTHYAIITDSHVASLHAERLRQALQSAATVTVASFPAGEWNKTRETWAALTDRLLAAGIGRDGAILALGGGVVGDVAGFVAATYLRGIPYVQVPTTLLAMIDSSIGGKTGVDTSAGKNLVGAFHQPRLVVADVQTLTTLPRNHIAAGLAEALKHGAIADRSYLDRLVAAREPLLGRDTRALAEAVAESVRIKALVVLEDEREHGRRAILNFGHTVGHAIEAAMGYSLLHGEAIAIGMVVEAQIGVQLGLTERTDADQLRSVVERFDLPSSVPEEAKVAGLLDAMRHDKKSRASTIRLSLIKRLGEPAMDGSGQWTTAVSAEVIEDSLKKAG